MLLWPSCRLKNESSTGVKGSAPTVTSRLANSKLTVNACFYLKQHKLMIIRYDACARSHRKVEVKCLQDALTLCRTFSQMINLQQLSVSVISLGQLNIKHSVVKECVVIL